MFKCQECGKKFGTTAAAQRAVNNGCSGCGGSDIDLDTDPTHVRKVKAPVRKQPHDGYHGEEQDPLRPATLKKCPDCGVRHNLGSHVDGCCPACVCRRLMAL
jgi:DNA-directed RNA polymerase subunit M/transcription elongation factor TFIIS